ncbi:MAG TPA: hypothetical protein PK280_10175 [Planctomycetota bacterium]|nr:hypothetical protein [Planctomycetota bacterium]
MPEKMDINKVIQGATRQMDLGDLAKLGHKRVRVIDEARIRELISQAVQQAIDAEMQDESARERRLAAEKSKRELEAKIAEGQAQLESGGVSSQEGLALRDEVAKLKAQLGEATQVVEAEKRRLAEESQKEFNKLLANAKAEVEAKSSALEAALRDMLGRAEQAIPREELASLPRQQPSTPGAAPATEMLEALSLRLGVLGRIAEGSEREVAARDQDIALAAAERHRLQNEVKSVQLDVEKHRMEAANLQRQLDARDQDIATAVAEQRRLNAEIKALKDEVEKRRQEAFNLQRQVDARGQESTVVAAERERAQQELKAAREETEKVRSELSALQRQMDGRDQDLATAAAEARRVQAETKALREEADKRRDELHSLQRQIDAREHDVMLAAIEQRRMREELHHIREQANRATELEGEIRRLNSERELLLARIEENRTREVAGSEQIAKLSEKLDAIKGAGVGGEQLASLKGALGEEIARQISWAMTAQKTGVVGVDPGLQLDALFSQKVETNVESIKTEKRGGESMAAKLAKLRGAKGGKESGGGGDAPQAPAGTG